MTTGGNAAVNTDALVSFCFVAVDGRAIGDDGAAKFLGFNILMVGDGDIADKTEDEEQEEEQEEE